MNPSFKHSGAIGVFFLFVMMYHMVLPNQSNLIAYVLLAVAAYAFVHFAPKIDRVIARRNV